MERSGTGLSVSDRDNPTRSCFTIARWTLGLRYRDILFTSLDHVVFNVSTCETGSVSKVPIMLDYKSSIRAACVDLSDAPIRPSCVKPAGFASVATVSDSPHNDHIVGNGQSNFLSCSGCNDFLKGVEGSYNYIVKKTCSQALIDNTDTRREFTNLRAQKVETDLKIMSSHGTLTVTIRMFFDSIENQHLALRTKDGFTLQIDNETGQLESTEVSKDPAECQCRHLGCYNSGPITYNLEAAPWTKVVRFQLKSSYCSYKIYGNNLNNYLDPGAGSGYNYQLLVGKRGSDTHVFQHGYGEFNDIYNHADDNKIDILQLGLEFDDINLYFHGENDIILAPNSYGFIAQLVEHCTGIAEVTGSNPAEA